MIRQPNLQINLIFHYIGKRNLSSEQKRRHDIKIGKLGEIATYHILKNKVTNITYPDFEIYTVKQKSWDYDIKSNEYNIHVKTQDSLASDLYGISWVFQKEDKKVFKTYNQNDIVSFVNINDKKQIAYIRAIYSINTLNTDNLFKPPKLNKLINNKLCIYYDDLVKTNKQILC